MPARGSVFLGNGLCLAVPEKADAHALPALRQLDQRIVTPHGSRGNAVMLGGNLNGNDSAVGLVVELLEVFADRFG